MNTQLLRSVELFLIPVLFLTSCSDDKKQNDPKIIRPVSVQVQIPTRHSSESITASGHVESQATAIISTRVMGFISDIKVKPGDKVQKGQLLVVISNGDIMAKRAQAQAMIVEAEAAVKDSRKDYERFEILYKQESATSKEFESATLRYTSAKAKAEATRQMKNETDAILAYTNLAAPFSGVITQKHIDEGSLANPGMPILTLEQPNLNYVRAFVSENDIGKLKNGVQVDVTIKSIGKKIRGKVSEISPSSQSTGGQFQIKVNLPESETDGLYSGMYVNINIPLKSNSSLQSVFVPAFAIIHKDQLSGLYTVGDDQTAQLRWLKIGKERGGLVEILSGLHPGERFIIHSDGKLYSGVPVLVK